MCVTGMTSTGSTEGLPLPRREGDGTTHRGHTTAHWGPEQEVYQGCLSFSLSITLPAFLLRYHPAQTPWGDDFGLSQANCLCTHSSLKDALSIPTQQSHHGPIHSHANAKVLGVYSYPYGVWLQGSSCSTDTHNYPLRDTSVGQSQPISPLHLCFLIALGGAAFILLHRTSAPH